MPPPVLHPRLAFGLFEVDLATGELWKAGFRIKLQSQPFKVLAALLERPGQIVTRDELQDRLWGKDTVVDFDHSLGTAINKIREALGDSAENPRFIETLSRRGYRFIAPVGPIHRPTNLEMAVQPAATGKENGLAGPALAGQIDPSEGLARDGVPVGGLLHVSNFAGVGWLGWLIAGVAVVCAAVGGYLGGSAREEVAPPHITQITRNGHISTGAEHMENLAKSATDGIHLFTSTLQSGHSQLVAISLAGGDVAPISTPDEVAAPALGDLSPDGSKLLLRNHLSPESEQPLWVVPSVGGSALRVGNILAHDAAWMLDGDGILFAAGNDLYLTRLSNANPTLYASLPGRAFWLRWQPDGKLLRFTLFDPIAHTLSLWEISPSDRRPRQVLPGWTNPANECCGVWTADGKSFIFQSGHGGSTNLWRLSGSRSRRPSRLTDGPLSYEAPVAAREGSKVYFLGVDARSQTKRYDPATRQLAPETGFLSNAIRVEYSRDGKWVAWTDDNGLLWRSRADGSEKLQLTPSSMSVFLSRWSPDGSHLALMAREPGKAWQLYLVQASGGQVQALLEENRNAADPSWSPDGQSLVFGRLNDFMGKENASRTLMILDLRTHGMQEIQGSEGLFSPRWSPDGRYIVALTLDQRKVRLYTVSTHTWSTLALDSGADPVWSSDGRYVYVHSSLQPTQAISRVSIPDGRVEQMIQLADPARDEAVDYVLGGLTPDNRPLIRERIFTGNFYSMDLDGERTGH